MTNVTTPSIVSVGSLVNELAIGTLRSILRQAKVTPEEFMENI